MTIYLRNGYQKTALKSKRFTHIKIVGLYVHLKNIFSVFRSSERKMSFKSKFIANDINLFGCKTLLQICNDRALWVLLLNVVTDY